MYNECADYKGKDWCATEVDAKSKTYKTFGWCEKDKCKEVDEAAEIERRARRLAMEAAQRDGEVRGVTYT